MVRSARGHIGRHYGGDRMTFVILPMLTMAIGFLMGVVVMDSLDENKRYKELEREIKRIKRRLEE